MTQQDRDRYGNALHAMQTAVQLKMNSDPGETTPKHLRFGVKSALVIHSALGLLLVEKGIFTTDELENALADAAEFEVETYCADLNLPPNAKLG